MGAGILTEAALGFLGFGIQPPDVSLGSLVSDYQGAFTSRPWLFIWPGVFIVVIVLCLQFIGDGLRDAFDPRQKRIPKRKDLEAAEADGRRPRGLDGDRTRRSARAVHRRCQTNSADDRQHGEHGTGADDRADVPVHRRRVALQPGVVEVAGVAQLLPAAADHQRRASRDGLVGRSPGRMPPADAVLAGQVPGVAARCARGRPCAPGAGAAQAREAAVRRDQRQRPLRVDRLDRRPRQVDRAQRR